MTIEYQDFGIGRVNATETVMTQKADKRSAQDLKRESDQVVRDVLSLFGLEWYTNGYTGQRNMKDTINTPLVFTVKLLSESLTEEGICFYQRKTVWGKRKHKNWLPMFAKVVGDRTVLGQASDTGYNVYIVRNGKLVGSTSGDSTDATAEMLHIVENY